MIAATDFFTTEVWTIRGLVTHYTLFVIDIATRRVHITGDPTLSEGRVEVRGRLGGLLNYYHREAA